MLKETRNILIDEEVQRRRAIKNTLANEGLEAKRQEEEVAERKRKADSAKTWEGTSSQQSSSSCHAFFLLTIVWFGLTENRDNRVSILSSLSPATIASGPDFPPHPLLPGLGLARICSEAGQEEEEVERAWLNLWRGGRSRLELCGRGECTSILRCNCMTPSRSKRKALQRVQTLPSLWKVRKLSRQYHDVPPRRRVTLPSRLSDYQQTSTYHPAPACGSLTFDPSLPTPSHCLSLFHDYVGLLLLRHFDGRSQARTSFRRELAFRRNLQALTRGLYLACSTRTS